MKALDIKNLKNNEKKAISERMSEEKKEAFSKIYDSYIVRIFRFVYLKTNSKETAEDLAAEVFLKCWRNFREKEGEKEMDLKEMERSGKIGSFLYKIARNLIIDFYRKKSFTTVEIDDDIREKIKDQKQDVLAILSAKQEIEEMMEALSKIKDEYREIIILRYVEDLPIGEIAEITGKSNGSARVSLHRAMRALKKEIK